MENFRCDVCNMDNMPLSHWTTYLHLDNQRKIDNQRLEEINGA